MVHLAESSLERGMVQMTRVRSYRARCIRFYNR